MTKKKERATTRASKTADAYRLISDVPLLVDTTELVTPEIAKEWLKKHNPSNTVHGPDGAMNWRAVNAIKALMVDGKWKFHGQGIIFDSDGNILTGQKRLWAVVLSGIHQYFRISRGSPPDTADVIDRGHSQTSRDLASRITRRKHTLVEERMAKDIFVLSRQDKPSADDLASIMRSYADEFEIAIISTRGIKKTRGVIMIMAAVCYLNEKDQIDCEQFILIPERATLLENKCAPLSLKSCWHRPAEHTAIMKQALEICKPNIKRRNNAETKEKV